MQVLDLFSHVFYKKTKIFFHSVIVLTSSVAFPMNFALFHQVIVAGGLDPELRHSSTATRDTEKGSAGGVMVTVCGKTERKIKEKDMNCALYINPILHGLF